MNLILKSKIIFKILFTSKAISLLPLVVAPIIKIEFAIGLLVGLMVADGITGILASYKRFKKDNKIETETNWQKFLLFFEVIKNQCLKKSGIKFLIYGATILIGFGLEYVFFIKSFSIPISEARFTLSVSITAWWCAVELYSILFENIKQIGFDIVGLFKKMKNTTKEFKDLKK